MDGTKERLMEETREANEKLHPPETKKEGQTKYSGVKGFLLGNKND